MIGEEMTDQVKSDEDIIEEILENREAEIDAVKYETGAEEIMEKDSSSEGDEAEDEPCLGGEHPVLRKLRHYIIAEIVDVLGLWGDVLCGLYGMKKAVDKCLALMEVTLVEW